MDTGHLRAPFLPEEVIRQRLWRFDKVTGGVGMRLHCLLVTHLGRRQAALGTGQLAEHRGYLMHCSWPRLCLPCACPPNCKSWVRPQARRRLLVLTYYTAIVSLFVLFGVLIIPDVVGVFFRNPCGELSGWGGCRGVR